MAIMAVIRNSDNELINTIVAEPTDYCPEGCRFVELPPNHTWVKGNITHYTKVPGTEYKYIQEF